MNTFQEISTEDLKKEIGLKSTSIIDIRPVDAYNGWKMLSEKRGGHIKSARSLPFKWIQYIDWIEIVRSKEILPDQRIVIYGYEKEEIEKVSERFVKSGYSRVYVYYNFLSEWIDDPSLQIECLARYDRLVYPDLLKKMLDGDKPGVYNGKKLVLCHGHYRNKGDYDKGHIPGAIALDSNSLESPETWNRRSPEELRETLQSHGITRDTTVVVYGRFDHPSNDDPFPGSSAGHLGSIRCAFIMMYAGVKDVRILNGGLQSWLDDGYEISTEESLPVPIEDCLLNIPERPELAVDVPEAKEMLSSNEAELVCVRSWPEFIGDVSGYNYIEKKGRIPGAVFGDCGTDAYHMENYRNLDHTCKEYHEIEKAWERVGVVSEKHNAFYCGTGWRGSEAWLNAFLMGWPRASVFDGGWFEWSNDPDNPYETGLPK